MKSFKQESHPNKYIKPIHEGQEFFDSPFCDKSYSKSKLLEYHIQNVHEGMRSHKCDFCNKTFFQPGNLKLHVESVHKELKRISCDQSFALLNIQTSKNTLCMHIKAKTKIWRF